ncbi:MAG: signal peptidase I [Rubrobacter sp.]|nr:signal peptidase I [Rubrobacter sp.]
MEKHLAKECGFGGSSSFAWVILCLLMSEQFPHYDENDFETRREQRESRSAKSGGSLRGVIEFIVILLVSFALVFGVVRPFIVEAFYIPSESMVPTLLINDRVLVNKFIYDFTEPDRGDILVFESVEGDGQDLIKRVAAVGGDEIRVQNGQLFVNGEPQTEPYLNQETPDASFFGPETVPEDHVFMMGDNRANSADSRVFGPVPYENIEGEAFLLFWPINRLDILL